MVLDSYQSIKESSLNDFFIKILIASSFNFWSSQGSMISFMHASLFCRAWCPLVILDPSKNLPKPHFLCSTKSVLCKRVNNGLGCFLIILVTFDAVVNLAHSSGVLSFPCLASLPLNYLKLAEGTRHWSDEI